MAEPGMVAPDKEGWLWKKGGGKRRSNWKKRWFVLRGPFLMYYSVAGTKDAPPPESKKKGTIAMLSAIIVPNPHRSRKHCIKIGHRDKDRREYFLAAATEEDKIGWLEFLAASTRRKGMNRSCLTYVDVGRYREALGVTDDASSAAIKKAYRRLALKHHPDKGGSISEFNTIVEAYEILSSLQEAERDFEEITFKAAVTKKAGVGMGLEIAMRQGGLEVYVKNTLHHTKAEGAIRVSDVLLEVDGVSVKAMPFDQLLKTVGALMIGSTTTCTFKRIAPRNPSVSVDEVEPVRTRVSSMDSEDGGDRLPSLMNMAFNDDSGSSDDEGEVDYEYPESDVKAEKPLQMSGANPAGLDKHLDIQESILNASPSELTLYATELESRLLDEISKSKQIYELLKAENEACRKMLQASRTATGALPASSRRTSINLF
jgi:hypothetical protein